MVKLYSMIVTMRARVFPLLDFFLEVSAFVFDMSWKHKWALEKAGLDAAGVAAVRVGENVFSFLFFYFLVVKISKDNCQKKNFLRGVKRENDRFRKRVSCFPGKTVLKRVDLRCNIISTHLNRLTINH